MLNLIKTEEQYKEYLKRIYALMQKELKENSKESNELESLSILVKNYEKAHYPIKKPIKALDRKKDLLLLMQQSDRSDEVMKALEKSDSLEDFNNFNNDFDESEWTW